jgi:hypothetical protein
MTFKGGQLSLYLLLHLIFQTLVDKMLKTIFKDRWEVVFDKNGLYSGKLASASYNFILSTVLDSF